MLVCVEVSTGLPVKTKQFLVFAHLTFCGEMNPFRVCLFCSTNAKLKQSLTPSSLLAKQAHAHLRATRPWQEGCTLQLPFLLLH